MLTAAMSHSHAYWQYAEPVRFGGTGNLQMTFLGLTVEGCRDAGSHVITYFAIPPGKEEAAGCDLLVSLADGFEVLLRNDLDEEGHEGCTLFRRSPSGLETMVGGHGWSNTWKPTDEASFLSAVVELAKFNRGGHWSTQASLDRRK